MSKHCIKHKGFTLIELLVVVAIIGVLAAVGVVAFNGFLKNSKISATKSNCSEINKIILSEIVACNAGMKTNFLNHSTTYCPLNSSTNMFTGGNINYTQHERVSSNAQFAIESWKHSSGFNFKNPYQPEVTAILNSASYELDIFIGYCQITTFGPKKLLSQVCWDYPCSDSNNRFQTTIDVE